MSLKLKNLRPLVQVADLRRVKAMELPSMYGSVRVRGEKLMQRNARILKRDPLCRICLATPNAVVTPSVQVDHIIPLHLGGPDDDEANLQGICIDCHLKKTAEERAARENGSAKYSPPRGSGGSDPGFA